MKLLLITVVVIFSANFGNSETTDDKSEELDSIHDIRIGLTNDQRDKFASNLTLVKVYKMRADLELAKKAQKMSKNCEDLRHGDNYRFELAPGGDDAARALVNKNYETYGFADPIKFMDYNGTKMSDMFEKAVLKYTNDPKINYYHYESLNPDQYKMGCDFQHDCTGTTKDGKKYTIRGLCLYGPTNKFTKASFDKGSKLECENGVSDYRHLCNPPSSASKHHTLLALISIFSLIL